MVDTKGIFSFLALTFAVTWIIECALILAGFRVSRIPPLYGQFVIMAVMGVPALAAYLTIRFVTREGFAGTFLRLGPLKPYLVSAFLIPACFILVYGLTWFVRLGRPDWHLADFLALMSSINRASGKTAGPMPPAAVVLPALFFSSVVVSPFLNGIFGFGEEFGWRGFLLPKLMPLGKPKAYALIGVIWGLWHAPLVVVGFNYPGYPVLGVLAMAAMTTGIGIFMNELTIRYRSSVLAGWVHGVFNGQGYGIWRQLFPGVNPLLGGFTGLVGIAVWFALGFMTVVVFRRNATGELVRKEGEGEAGQIGR